jgi:hypothetical protein
MENIETFRSMAALLRARTGQNVTRLAYVKGIWQLGKDKIEVGGSRWCARPDWMFCGHVKWWNKQLSDVRVGYVQDGYVPVPRDELGDLDERQWRDGNRGRDPWELQWGLPLFNQVSGEDALYTTNTYGGRDALSALLTAYCDRIETTPNDNAILPVVELDTDKYRHPTRGDDVHIPLFNVVGWAVPPNKPRPPLPKAEPPRELPAPDPFDADSIPF